MYKKNEASKKRENDHCVVAMGFKVAYSVLANLKTLSMLLSTSLPFDRKVSHHPLVGYYGYATRYLSTRLFGTR